MHGHDPTPVAAFLLSRWVYVMWEFVKFNLLQGGSSLYGSHPWHWNFSQVRPRTEGILLRPQGRLFSAALPLACPESLKGCPSPPPLSFSCPPTAFPVLPPSQLCPSASLLVFVIPSSCSQGFPAIAASYVPLMALGAFVGGRPLIRMAAIYVGLMSLPAHKEFR